MGAGGGVASRCASDAVRCLGVVLHLEWQSPGQVKRRIFQADQIYRLGLKYFRKIITRKLILGLEGGGGSRRDVTSRDLELRVVGHCLESCSRLSCTP